MPLSDAFRKAAGLFVEITPDPNESNKEWNVMDAPAPTPEPVAPVAPVAKTVEQIVREAPGPNLDEIKPAATPSVPVIDASGKVNYGSIYQLANLPTSPFTCEQVLEILSSMPPDLPLETKRATVKVTLDALSKSTGATPETVVTDAGRKLAALAAYAKSFVDQADGFVKKTEIEIAALEQDIAAKKAAIEDAKSKQAQMVEACTKESDRIDDVLEFFSLDVSPSKYAPKP